MPPVWARVHRLIFRSLASFPCRSRLRGMAIGRSAMSTRSASRAQNPREGNRSRATRLGISFGLSSPQARNKASTWDEYSCELVAPLTSARTKAGCRESAIGSAPQFIAAMAIATQSECDMLTAPPKPPNKERAIPPLSLQAGEEWRDFSEESYFHH